MNSRGVDGEPREPNTVGMNIPEMALKIKNAASDVLSEWGILLLVFFLSLASFGLGRLSALESSRPAVSVYEAPAAAASATGVVPKEKIAPMQAGGQVVASKSGEVYYFPWCGGATRISAANKVTFASADAAKKAGYRAAKNCKGLE